MKFTLNENTIRKIAGWLIQGYQALNLWEVVTQMRGWEETLRVPIIITAGYTMLVVLAVVVGGALCWRLSGWRKAIAFFVSALLLVAVYLSSNHQFDVRTNELPQARVAAFKETDQYKNQMAAIESARKDLDEQIRRTNHIPDDFTSQYRQNESAKAEDRKQIASLEEAMSQELKLAEGSGTSMPQQELKQQNPAMEGVFSVLLALALEVLALTLTSNSKPSSRRPHGPAWRFGFKPQTISTIHLVYLRAARDTGNGTILGGYRRVATHRGIGPGTARRLQRECQDLGYIRDRQLAIELPPESGPSGLLEHVGGVADAR